MNDREYDLRTESGEAIGPLLDSPRESPPGSEPGPSAHATTGAASPDAPSEDPPVGFRSISVSELHREVFRSVRAGMALDEDIYDEAGVLLLAAGSVITTRFLQLLQNRGVARVQLRDARRTLQAETAAPLPVTTSKNEVSDGQLHTPQSRDLDKRMAGLLQQRIEFRSVQRWRRPRLPIEHLKAEIRRGIDAHAATSDAVARICEKVGAGRRETTSGIRSLVLDFVNRAALDFDLLPLIVSFQESKGDYLFDHCVNVSLISMAMACQLGLEHPRILDVGLGALLQDVGMLRVPREIRLARRALSGDEWKEIHRHPLHTLEILANLRGVPVLAKFVAYQAHERMNGLGYPRGRDGSQVHGLARIVSIADTFAAMTRPRPYRPPVPPYECAKTILLAGRENTFDRTLIRALLDTISLFPVGSIVALNDGRTVRVLRANPGLHTRPVVEEVTKDGCSTGSVFDLAAEPELKVVSAQ